MILHMLLQSHKNSLVLQELHYIEILRNFLLEVQVTNLKSLDTNRWRQISLIICILKFNEVIVKQYEYINESHIKNIIRHCEIR